MDAAEKTLKELIDRHLPSPTHLELAVSGDRVLDALRSTSPHLQKARVDDIPRVASRWRALMSTAAAAVLLAAVIGAAIVWPRGARVYAAGDNGLQFTLADDSRVEMRAHSELTVDRAADGIRIDLKKGGIIVNAAKQRSGHLYVQTKDMAVSVVGTVFVVNAAEDGSRIAVIEGQVHVRDGKTETTLRPGHQVLTNPTVQARPVAEEIAWSRRAAEHFALLQQAVPHAPEFVVIDTITIGPGQVDQPASAQVATDKPAAPRPQFEEASIRPCLEDAPSTGGRGGGANSLVMTPGRFHAYCITLSTLIRTAYEYDVADDPLSTSDTRSPGPGLRFGSTYTLGGGGSRSVRGGPDWIRSDMYTIEAVADSAVPALTMQRAMLQELVERRFQLRVHIEAEQVPAVAMTVAPGGLKLKPMEPGSCSTEGSTDAVRAERGRRGWSGPVLMTEAAFFGVKPTCGGMLGDPNGPNLRFEHVGQRLGGVATTISNVLGVPVRDRTGIMDRFTFGWEFGPDESTPDAMRWAAMEPDDNPRPGFGGPPTLPKAPPLLTVLEQELGLRIEPIRVPNEFIVIDRVERPSAN